MKTHTPKGHFNVPIPVKPTRALALEHYQALAAAALWDRHGSEIVSALHAARWHIAHTNAAPEAVKHILKEIADLLDAISPA